MKFMASWSIQQEQWLPVLKRFTSMSPQEQANAGERVKIIGRWHDVATRTGVVIFESNDLAAVQRYIGKRNPHVEIDFAPVLDDEEATVVYRQIIADHNA